MSINRRSFLGWFGVGAAGLTAKESMAEPSKFSDPVYFSKKTESEPESEPHPCPSQRWEFSCSCSYASSNSFRDFK